MTQTCAISKILLPVDLSEGSRSTLDYAGRLAAFLGNALAGVTLLHVTPAGFLSRHIGYVDFRGEDLAQSEPMKKLRDEHIGRDIMPLLEEGEHLLRSRGCTAPVERTVATGDPVEEIVRVAQEGRFSTIVMASRALSEIQRFFLGSVTRKVVGHAPCDVLVVPPGAEFSLKTILVATDGSDFSRSAASQAIRLARSSGGRLIALGAVASAAVTALDIVEAELPRDLIEEEELKEATANVTAVVEKVKEAGIEVRGLVVGAAPAEAIIDTAREQGADLIAMGSHGRTGINRLLMGSVAERVLTLASCPVLVVKSPCVD
jgi:nucleotide-binding universal stress UspA family protein